MRNTIKISAPKISENRIDYEYEIAGNWSNVFLSNEKFFIEYNRDISEAPESVAIIPLLCNILPIAWVYDAEIYIDSCDKVFFDSIPEFKKGYEGMYPHMQFKGNINAKIIESNSYQKDSGAAAFFSGGVDAFNTLVQHIEEKPVLLTIWGADVKLEDEKGWENVLEHLKNTAVEFNIDYVTIKSNFRKFINTGVINDKTMDISKDNWWHGFQHGIGIIGHAAPVCYVMSKTVVYFASSFTAADKGTVTCASDPTIDNFVRFGSTHVVHDGYEFDRQDKIHNIVEYCRENDSKIALRVCWQSTGGKNCCGCEKCWRTILGIIAEGEKSANYDMEYTTVQLKNYHKIYFNKKNIPDYRRDSVYAKIQRVMRQNCKCEELPKELQWFYNIDIKELGHHPYRQLFDRCKNKLKKFAK